MDDGHDPPPFLLRILFKVDEMVAVKCADGSHSQALRDRFFRMAAFGTQRVNGLNAQPRPVGSNSLPIGLASACSKTLAAVAQ
jgi:hypothetical protein